MAATRAFVHMVVSSVCVLPANVTASSVSSEHWHGELTHCPGLGVTDER